MRDIIRGRVTMSMLIPYDGPLSLACRIAGARMKVKKIVSYQLLAVSEQLLAISCQLSASRGQT